MLLLQLLEYARSFLPILLLLASGVPELYLMMNMTLTKESHLVVLSNHLRPVFCLSASLKLLHQLMLASLQFSFSFHSSAGRHLVVSYMVDVFEQTLQVSYATL